jgi:hypothetical protein
MPDLIEVDGPKLRFNFHPGQLRAWNSPKRFVGIIAGSQSGKTSFMPAWLWREITRRGPGDYAVVCPTFTLLELKALPEFRKLFERHFALGTYVGSPVRKFTFSDDGCRRTFGCVPDVPTQVFFGYAENPDSLESATYKAVVCDEAGQKAFKRESWEALLRRLSIHRGRALITTTPYFSHGWLKTEIYDRWVAGDPDAECIQFASNLNPAFPQEEYERARATLPAWKFSLFYMGKFARPAGLIYDSFDEVLHKVPRFSVPDDWPRYLGLDFGGVNTAGAFYANQPNTPNYYLYRTYKAGGRTAAEHAHHLLKGEPSIPTCVGGSRSEGQWRSEFRAGGVVNGEAVPGLPVREPDCREVEVGIGRVYGAHKRGEILVFDDLSDYLDEKLSYARKLGPDGEPTAAIEDKSDYHLLDAERYIIGFIKRPTADRRLAF